jgi:glycosyltransferase involved in cell wall biosynthesis
MGGLLGGVVRNLSPFAKLLTLGQFDVVNYINTLSVVHGMYTRYLDLPVVRRMTRLMSYYALGCDEIGLIRRNPDLPYNPCKGCQSGTDVLGFDCVKTLDNGFERNLERAEKYFDVGACSMVEYSRTEELFPGQRGRRIPLPVDVDAIAFRPAKPSPRVKVVHTPTRRGFKGTDLIVEAVEILRRTRNDFDFEIVEGLGYDAYIQRMADADVVIDQVHGQSPGMNGLEMMATGKMVMTGATPLGRSFFPYMHDMPAVDASPEPPQLAADLSALLDRKQEFGALAKAARDYVARHHGLLTVASQFVEHWERNLAPARGAAVQAQAVSSST